MDSQNLTLLQSYIKKIEARLARLETRDFDLHGRRTINAADGSDLQDYATVAQLIKSINSLKIPPFSTPPIFSIAYNSVVQTVPTGAGGALLTYDTNMWDVGGIHSITTNPTRFTCNVGGVYLCFCQCRYPAGATAVLGTYYQLQSLVNGVVSVPKAIDMKTAPGIIIPRLLNLVPLALNPHDYVEFFTDHNVGAGVNTTADQSYAGIIKLD